MIAHRLKVARAAGGVSLRALAARIDHLVTPQAIGKYERGEMIPGSQVLAALARALDVPLPSLLRPERANLETVEFRTHAAAGKKQLAAVRARVLDCAERQVEVEDLLHAAGNREKWPSQFPWSVAQLTDAEEAGNALRRGWNLGGDPIPDMATLLEDRGVMVFSLALPPGVSGLGGDVRRADGTGVRFVCVNSTHAGERQRFTLAHELGHLALQPTHGVDVEKACQRFAGAFLVPATALRGQLGAHRARINIPELFALKSVFGVSAQAIAYRCQDAGIVGAEAARTLFRAFSQRGWRTLEPMPVPGESPSRFRRLCLRALSEGVVTESKAAELLNVRAFELDSLINPSNPAGA
jgi:Zn-dependent peptidase ImmA (M78 family)/DNA-binding XRE family transcriptional regulator